jgi:hypothetical protein
MLSLKNNGSVVEQLPSVLKALDSIPSTHKQNKTKKMLRHKASNVPRGLVEKKKKKSHMRNLK